jgi:hypothetical protein
MELSTVATAVSECVVDDDDLAVMVSAGRATVFFDCRTAFACTGVLCR